MLLRIFAAAVLWWLSVSHANAQTIGSSGPGWVCASSNPNAVAYPFSRTAFCASSPLTVHVFSPVQICAAYKAMATLTSGHEFTCQYKKGDGGYYVGVRRWAETGVINQEIIINPDGAGVTCWESAYSSFSTSYTTTPPAGCDVCPDGLEWNSTDLTCEEPACPTGEVWDDQLSACRAECEGANFFHYSTLQCRPQCPVGLTYQRMLITNRVIPAGSISVPTVMGCKVEYHYWQVEDTREPISGEGYFHGDDYTGSVVLNWWTFTEAIPVTLVTQAEYEEATGTAGYFEEESVSVGVDVKGYDLSAVQGVEESPMEEAGDVTAVHVLCSGGEKRIAITVNGTLEEAIFLGPCSVPDQEFVPGDPSLATPSLASIQAALSTMSEGGEEQAGILGEIRDTANTIGEKLQSLYDGIVGTGEECTGEGCQIDGGAFPTEADPEGAYTREFSEGSEGVGEALEGATLSGDSDLQDFMTDIQPIWPETVPGCLSWDVDVVFWGATHFEPPCWLWDMLAIFLKLFAVVCAWGLLFGARAREA